MAQFSIILLLMIVVGLVKSELAYQCTRPYDIIGDPSVIHVLGEKEYQRCGAFCVCKAFEIICLKKTLQLYVAYTDVSLAESLTCSANDCICNT